jgi:phage-related protein (TIGR01555 family)
MSKKNRDRRQQQQQQNQNPPPAEVKGQRQVFTRDGKTVDGLSNFEAALGTNANNLLDASTYSFNFITKNRILLEAMYRTSWVIGKAVDIPAEDMTQCGIEINSTMKPDDTELLNETLDDLRVFQSLCSTLKWSGLYGTGMGLILIDGQDTETPLNISSIGKGQFKGILPMDRWQLNPDTSRLVQTLGPDMGLPEFYRVNPDALLPKLGTIHYSRFIRLDAIELPHYQKQTEQLWAESLIERIHDRLIAFDSTTVGAAQLVFKAYLRTWHIEDLRNLISMGGKAYEAVLKNVETVRRLQANEGITLVDAKDKFETHQYSFAGLDSVLLNFGQQLCGAIDIPSVRFFGEEPAGLGDTGEMTLRTYYGNVKRKQNTKLRQPVKKLLQITSQSLWGKPLPDGFGFDFRSLWQLTDGEKAEISAKDSESVDKAYGSGLIKKSTALKELRQQSHVSGRFSNITDEDITEAENEPPPGEMIGPDGKPTGTPAAPAKVSEKLTEED